MIVVMSMAGRGQRLAGGSRPKPFIEVAGRPMLAWAFDSLDGVAFSRAVFVALAEHVHEYGLPALARSLAGDRAEIVAIDTVTDGQLCSVLQARTFLTTDEDVLVVGADTLVVSSLGAAIAARPTECRGLISVARLPGDHWSFVDVDARGRARRVAEKQRISPLTGTGMYYFSSAREFTGFADAHIARGKTTRGEFYVMPLYQDYIDAGLHVGIAEASDVWDMGNPDALRRFEAHLASR